jgi:hypothetical protein
MPKYRITKGSLSRREKVGGKMTFVRYSAKGDGERVLELNNKEDIAKYANLGLVPVNAKEILDGKKAPTAEEKAEVAAKKKEAAAKKKAAKEKAAKEKAEANK